MHGAGSIGPDLAPGWKRKAPVTEGSGAGA